MNVSAPWMNAFLPVTVERSVAPKCTRLYVMYKKYYVYSWIELKYTKIVKCAREKNSEN